MRGALPLVATLLAPVAAAQDTAPPGEDIVVTGRGLAARPGDAAFDIVTIDAERIGQAASGRLESVLADVAGLQQFRRSDSRSANPTSQGVSLRGLGGSASSRALLLVDGVPQSDPFGGWVPFTAYATDRIGSVRVTRGGGSGYHGAGALAGTIEIESAAPATYAALAGGSRDSLDARAGVGLVRDGGFATLSGAYARGDGFVPIVAGDRGPADQPARYESGSVAARGVLDVAGVGELTASLLGFSDVRDRGTAFAGSRSEGADASLRLVGRGRWGFVALAYLQTRGFASTFAAVNAARTVATPTLNQYSTPATGAGGRLEVVPPTGEGIDLRLGIDTRTTRGRTGELFAFAAGVPTRRREAGGATESHGAFVDASLERGGLTVTLGGRLDRWRIYDGRLAETPLSGVGAITDVAYPDRSGTRGTGRTGVALRALPWATVRGAAYLGWRLPTLNELYRPFRLGADATGANAALAPERLRGVDVGVTLAPAAGVTVSATLFDNRLSDAIANVTAGVGPGSFPGVGFVGAGGVYRVRRNLAAIDARGAEVDAAVRRGPFTATASWSHAVSTVRGGPLGGLRPAATPRDAASAGIAWAEGGRLASATVRHVASQFEDDQNLRRLPPATTLDALVAWPISRRLVVEARGENIFDATVVAALSASGVAERATPRTLWLALRASI